MKVGARVSGAALWTTELVLIEFLTHFAGRGSHLRSGAVQTVDSLRRHPKINIVPLIETPFDAAYDEYRRSSDKGWSLTDCASFLLIRQKGISMAAAYVGHFEQARFVVVE